MIKILGFNIILWSLHNNNIFFYLFVATEVITVFIFHEPSQLSTLQDNGLPWVMLNSIINKHIPVTREVRTCMYGATENVLIVGVSLLNFHE